MRTQVLIVGAGPVGLTAAMDLASRGIDVVVAEIRHAGDPPSVKCNHVSARSMEVFRRLGVAAKLRDAGLPADFPNDCSYRTTATGIELCRIDIPSRARRYSATGGPDTWWPTPEPPHRINQLYLEPILFGHAAAQPRITILARTEITEIEQDDDHVVAQARDLDSGRLASHRSLLRDRVRRQPFAGSQIDRCKPVRNAGDPARAIDLHRSPAAQEADGRA